MIIERFEKVRNSDKSLDDLGINLTLYRAYMVSKKSGNVLIDFSDVVWDSEVKEIVFQLKEVGVTEFTVSSDFSGLVKVLAEFVNNGCRLMGIVKVNSRYMDIFTDMQEVIPAIKLSII